MRHALLAAGAACLLAGCSMTPAQKAAVIKIGCAVDGVVQPIALPLIAGLGAGGASAASADTLLHPAVVAACKALGGTPALVAAPQAAPPAPSAVPAPAK